MEKGNFYFVRLCYQASRSALRQNAQIPTNTAPAFCAKKRKALLCIVHKKEGCKLPKSCANCRIDFARLQRYNGLADQENGKTKN